MRTTFSYGPQKTNRLASSAREWSMPYTSGSAGTTMWPKTLAPAIIKTEEQEFVDLIETRALEQMIEEARLQWHYYVPPKPELDVEHDIWVQLPPKREFTLNVQIEYQGRAKPAFFVDWVEDDE